ncbi:hypothetical protein ACWC24_36365, partial [Streptomyces sp. NPDC001443]
MTGPAGQEPEYAALMAELAAFRMSRLSGLPSDRALAAAAKVSPTTIGQWLRGDRFPQQVDPVLVLVRAVRAQAESTGAADGSARTLLDAARWRRAYQSEARRRADATRTAVGAGQGRAVLERMRPGRPLAEVTDPFAFDLEVHRAIGSPVAGLPVLPEYVPREHDHALAEVVAQAAAGASRIAVMVGESSTGKTRACWEALHPLRALDEPWRLWHPIDPTRPGAALAELADLPPYTVVWLNEAQFYLEPDPLGEQVAAGLRTLLHHRPGPVLVLATLWPDHWNTLTTRTTPDRHAQARELLDGHRINVPHAFTGTDLAALTDTAGRDPRLGEAAEHAQDGQITQYLAGGPVLLDRYHNAPPATRALIDAAMDARRLGAGPRIPLAWLTQTAPGYLTDTEWDHTGDDWLEQALDYVTTPCHGIPGILAPVKTGTPRNQRTTSPATGHGPGTRQGPLYQLADYLDQHGRRHRAEEIPPIDFWTAAATHAHRSDLTALGTAAWDRGLYRDAAQLHKHATTHGDARAAGFLVDHLHDLYPTDHRPAQHAIAHVSLDDLNDVRGLLSRLLRDGAQEQAATLAERAAAHAPLDSPYAVAGLLDQLREAGLHKEVARLMARDPVAHASLDSPDAAELLESLRRAGLHKEVARLMARDPVAHASLDSPFAVAELLASLRKVGAQEQAATLAERAAAHAPLDNPLDVAALLRILRKAGAQDQVATLAERAVAHASLDDPYAVAGLLNSLREAGAQEQVASLAEQAVAHALPDNSNAVVTLLDGLREAGAQDQVAGLLARDPAAHASLDDPYAVAGLLDGLRRAGAQDQVAGLLARDPAAHASLDDPYAVAGLLD